MTVHARQLARLCRERLAAQPALPTFNEQPQQQQAAIESTPDAVSSQGNAKETEQPVR